MAPAARAKAAAKAQASGGTGGAGGGSESEKARKLLEKLEPFRASSQVLLSVSVPAGGDLERLGERLATKLTAVNAMQSRDERLSIQETIKAAQMLVRKHGKVASTGLVLFCGQAEAGARLAVDIVPARPLGTALFMLDSRFHTAALREVLEDDGDRIGFVIADGAGALFGVVRGKRREILDQLRSGDQDSPSKKGGARKEGGGTSVQQVADMATKLFLNGDKPNVARLVVAGPGDTKSELGKPGILDRRLEAILLRPLLDVAAAGERGFEQAVGLAAEPLRMVRVLQEKNILGRFLDSAKRHAGRSCYGSRHTVKALEMGAVETLIVWEGLSLTRLVVQSRASGEQRFLYMLPELVANPLVCPETGETMDVLDSAPFVEWITGHIWIFGAELELVTGKSQEGEQFCQGFGGVGALLRYHVDFDPYEDEEPEGDDNA